MTQALITVFKFHNGELSLNTALFVLLYFIVAGFLVLLTRDV